MPSEQREDPPVEDRADRITRNWSELVQELRVSQTGVQILTGFLLTLPFASRFDDLDALQRAVYLCVLSGSVLTTALLLAPVVYHRMLFRRRERPWLVVIGNRAAQAGLTTLAATVSGVMWLVFDLVAGRWPATVALAVSVVGFGTLWVAIPVARRRGAIRDAAAG